MRVHTHILMCYDIGIRVVLKTKNPDFEWQPWIKKLPAHDNTEARALGIYLLAQGIGR